MDAGKSGKIFVEGNCFRFHGCPNCNAPDAILVDGKTASQLYAEHKDKVRTLKNHFNVPVHVHWSCKFHKSLDANPKMRKQFQDIELVDPLHPRKHGLRGGKSI
jgi:hypothetical protein